MKKSSDLNFEESVFDNLGRHGEDYLELPTSKNAFIVIGIGAFMVALLIVWRVGFLNFEKKQFYEARAAANLSREINLPAPRAMILDKFGKPLTKNIGTFSVFANLSVLFRDEGVAIQPLIAKVAEILNLEQDAILEAVKKADLERSNWISIARNISANEAIGIKSLNSEAIQVIDDFKREYIDGPVFSQVLGYTGAGESNTVIGKSGLEFYYDEFLRGEDGRYVFYEDAEGKVLDQKIISFPELGEPLITTLDGEFQKYFYSRLKSALEALGREAGAGIALNPKTGEILALVSLPSFDNNVFNDRSRNKELSRYLGSSSKPLFNRAVSGVYSPGSTIKPLLALSAMKDGVLNPNTQIFSAGTLEVPNPYFPDKPSVFVDWKPHGWVDLSSALAKSSNIYFYLAGGGLPQSLLNNGLFKGFFRSSGLGIDKLNDYWKKFGLGSRTGVDLPFEASGFLPNPNEKKERTGDIWRLGDTYNVSIGQGDLLVTPLQLVDFIASIANGGKVYKPFIKKDSAIELRGDYSDWFQELQAVQGGLRQGVSESYGSSHVLSSLPFKAAGKTGTPQIQNNAKTNAFFIGYAPLNDSQGLNSVSESGAEIAILVLIENAKEGSLNALPVAKDVLGWYYEHRLKTHAN